MSSTRWNRGHLHSSLMGAWRAGAVAIAVIAFGAAAAAASAAEVNIVRQGAPPAKIPAGTHYYKTIQAAVNASTAGDWVLIEPGVYDEAVKVTQRPVRDLDQGHEPQHGDPRRAEQTGQRHRNLQGEQRLGGKPDGAQLRHGGMPAKTAATRSGGTAASGSGKIGAHGWYGTYLTAYDTGLNGGYGIFTGNETEGSWENIYASGFNDSGMYLGACQECDARDHRRDDGKQRARLLGLELGREAGDRELARSATTSIGIAPNSENPGDGPPPQDGECGRPNIENPNPTPTIKTTKIQRCTIIRNNLIIENNNLTVPVNESTAIAPWGNGVELPGDYADLVEKNVIVNNPNERGARVRVPEPASPRENGFKGTIFFQLAGNRISNNVFAHNGYQRRPVHR